jgi:hypothetical protein
MRGMDCETKMSIIDNALSANLNYTKKHDPKLAQPQLLKSSS